MIWVDTMAVQIESGDDPSLQKRKPQNQGSGIQADPPAVFAAARRVIEQLTAKYPNWHLVPRKEEAKAPEKLKRQILNEWRLLSSPHHPAMVRELQPNTPTLWQRVTMGQMMTPW